MQSGPPRSHGGFTIGPPCRIFIAMEPIVYLNGQYLPLAEAAISPLDRGFLFADGVYEVVRYYGGRPLAMQGHLDRLAYSLDRIRLVLPDSAEPLDAVSGELLRRNNLSDASVYWQITRGAARPRDHAFPDPPVPPTVFAMADAKPPLDRAGPAHRMTAITRPDDRWKHCAIKSVALLPNALARQQAADAGCGEAILLRDQIVTEGTARSVFIVKDGKLLTHPLDGTILGSITRQILLDLAEQRNIPAEQTRFTREQLFEADEVITVGTTTEVAAVTHIDGQPIADGQPGPITEHLWQVFREHVVNVCEL